MPELTIITANIDSPEWLELLIKSLLKYSVTSPEIIVIDNGSLEDNLKWIKYQKNITLYEAKKNLGHGGAMDLGTKLAKTKYICFLDIDSHVMREGWDRELIEFYKDSPDIKMIGCRGPEHKPLHPPLFFYEREFILNNNLSFGYIPNDPLSTDTAQKVYWDILDLGYKVMRLEKGIKEYGCIGDEIHFGKLSFIYHHWYGTRFCENNPKKKKERLDGYTLDEHLKNKKRLFEQPKVKEILEYNTDIVFRDYEKCRREMRELDGFPWIEPGAIELLDKVVNKDSMILEVGAGSSTVWFAGKGKMVLSFEHNELWHALVKDELEHRGIKNVVLRYEPDYPQNGLPDIKGEFDIVLVDGPTEGRNSPIVTGVEQIKSGGYFILDDAQREELYAEGLALLEKQDWENWDFNVPGYVRHTRVWKVK